MQLQYTSQSSNKHVIYKKPSYYFCWR